MILRLRCFLSSLWPLLRARRLEMIHMYVEILDKYFGNVCELDLIFNFHKAYYILDEVFVAGELQETSKRQIQRIVAETDELAVAEDERQ